MIPAMESQHWITCSPMQNTWQKEVLYWDNWQNYLWITA